VNADREKERERESCWIYRLKKSVFNGIKEGDFSLLVLRPNAGHGLLMLDVSRSHTATQHSQYDYSGRVVRPSQGHLSGNTQTSMPSAGFEPAIPAGERPHTARPLGPEKKKKLPTLKLV
jgi:hypothetical protein